MKIRKPNAAQLPAEPTKRSPCIDPSETVVFFPTAADFDPLTSQWHLPIHGWVYQPAELKRLRRAAAAVLKRLAQFRFPHADLSTPLFQKRLNAFLHDNERNNRIHIQLLNHTLTLNKSGPNGHFKGDLSIPASQLPPAALTTQWLPFHAVCDPADPRIFEGRIQLLPPTGLSVISDIDDTIKITGVLDRRTLLRSTFLQEFQSVPDMAALYQHWATHHHAAFHYISASPWHLYPFLADFLSAQAFPAGTFHLRAFRLMPRDIPTTLRPSHKHKTDHARALFTRFPARRFILVGDSGERDPAIYAALAAAFPAQVAAIFIRNTTNQPANHPRWTRDFRALPRLRWRIFDQPGELRTADFAS